MDYCSLDDVIVILLVATIIYLFMSSIHYDMFRYDYVSFNYRYTYLY